MDTIISKTPEQTYQIGRQWGQRIPQGTVIALFGDVGAGKTVLTSGLAAGLGVQDPVRSPTFTLLHEYHGGRGPLFHLDLYRLDGPDAVWQAGLEPYLIEPTGVTVVEWADRWFGPLNPGQLPEQAPRPRRLLLVWIESPNPEERILHYEDLGVGMVQ